MMSLLALCEVEHYVHGEIQQPNKTEDPVGHDNWKKNDNYAKMWAMNLLFIYNTVLHPTLLRRT